MSDKPGRPKKHIRPAFLRKLEDAPVNVVPLRSVEETGVIIGQETLEVRYPSKPGLQPETLDLSDWKCWNELGIAVAHYFNVWGQSARQSTRLSNRNIAGHFSRYLSDLRQQGKEVPKDVSGITDEVVSGYVNWLNSSADSSSRGKPLGSETKRQRYQAVVRMIFYWRSAKKYKSRSLSELHLPRNPWPGAHLEIVATQVLDPISVVKIAQAAISEISADLAKRQAVEAALETDDNDLPDPRDRSVIPFKDIMIRVRMIAKLFNGRIPTHIELESYPGLARSLKNPYGSLGEVSDILHYSPRALVPYIVLLDLETTFNAEGILGLNWIDIADHPIFGPARWQITASKARAKSGLLSSGVHRRSFPATVDEPYSVVWLLKAIRKYTERTQQLVSSSDSGRIFVFFADGRYRSFSTKSGEASSDNLWASGLKSFIANDLPKFTLRTLRATGGDIVHQLTSDIKAQQLILGHKNLGTTTKHYRSGAAKQRDEELLAHAILLRERYVSTKGRADSRGGSALRSHRPAVTPGFYCLDPFNSPFPNEVAGRLCTSFGRCPSCPLAAVDPSDPRSYARLVQFRDKILEASSVLASARYLITWAPQLKRLQEFWLLEFTAQAKLLAPTVLPSFPDLE